MNYASMLAIGMLPNDDGPFGSLIERCGMSEVRANAPRMMEQ